MTNKVEKTYAAFSTAWTTQLQTRIYAVPVLLGLGIALYFIWPHEPSLSRPLLATLLLAALAWWVRGIEGVNTRQVLSIIALMIVMMGFTAAKIRSLSVASPMIKTSIDPVGVEGRVQSLEQLEGGVGFRIMLSQVVIDDVPLTATPRSLRLLVRKGGEGVKTGASIRVFAKIEPASPPTTPGGFDFRRHAFFKQIGGYGYVLGAPKILTTNCRPGPRALLQANPRINSGRDLETLRGPGLRRDDSACREGPSIASWFENARNHISELVNKTLEPRQAGMVAALLTGERAAINKEDWQALRDSGLAHLLAISGANVDMVAIIVFFMVRLSLAAIPRVALKHPIKKYAAVAAFVAALTYVLLVYPSTPTLRGLLMVGIVLLAILLDRSPISLRLVAATATAILLVQPEQLLSPSFQLSYAAVTALVAVFEWCGPWLKRVHADAGALKRGLMYLVGVCVTTVIATLATAPISLYHFQTLALYGVLANVLAVPIMTFLIMPLGILCYVLIPLGMAVSSLHVLGTACDWILMIAHLTAGLPGARFTPPAMPLPTFLLIITSGMILCFGARALKTLAVVPLCLAIFTLALHERPHQVVLQGGKVVMARLENGEVITSTRRYARRQQGDWVRYWGGDETQGARVVKGLAVDEGAVTIPNTQAPVAIYKDRVEIIGPRVMERLWD